MTTSPLLTPSLPQRSGFQNSSPRAAKLLVNLCVRMWNTLLSHTHPSTTNSRFIPLTSPPRMGFLRLNPFAVRWGNPSGSSSSNFTDFQGLAPCPAPLIVSPSMLFGIGVPSPTPEGVESVSSSIASRATFSPASTAPRPLTPAASLPLARVIIRPNACSAPPAEFCLGSARVHLGERGTTAALDLIVVYVPELEVTHEMGGQFLKNCD